MNSNYENYKDIKQKADLWWDEIIENDRCKEMKIKYGHYGHDMGITMDDVIKMWKNENSYILTRFKKIQKIMKRINKNKEENYEK